MESIALLKLIIWKKREFFHSLTFCSYTQVGIFALNFIKSTELGFSTSLSLKH
jgi:hypothetical protein